MSELDKHAIQHVVIIIIIQTSVPLGVLSSSPSHSSISPSLLQLVTSYPAIIHSGSCLSLVPLVSSTSSVLCQSPLSFSRGWGADSYNYPSVCEMNHWVGDWAAWWETSILSRANEWAVPSPHLSLCFSLSRSLSFSHFSFHLCGCFYHRRLWHITGCGKAQAICFQTSIKFHSRVSWADLSRELGLFFHRTGHPNLLSDVWWDGM